MDNRRESHATPRFIRHRQLARDDWHRANSPSECKLSGGKTFDCPANSVIGLHPEIASPNLGTEEREEP